MVTGNISRAMDRANAGVAKEVRKPEVLGTVNKFAFDSVFMNSQNSGNVSSSDKVKGLTADYLKEDISTKLSRSNLLKDTSAKTGTGALDITKIENSESVYSEVADRIKEALKESLGIDDDTLEQLLLESGFTLMDMLVPNNLAAFVADYLVDGDCIRLLTDSDAGKIYAKLGNDISDIVSEAAKILDIPYEEVKEALKDFENAMAESNISSAKEDTADSKSASIDYSKTESKVSTSNAALEGNTDSAKSAVEVTYESDKSSDNSSHDGKDNLSGQFNNIMTQQFENVAGAKENFSGYTVDAGDVIRQLVDAVKINVTEQTQSMEITLSPEHLGKVELTVAAKDGVLTAKLTTTNEDVRAVIENQLIVLKENFQNSGLKVEAIEVTIASHGFEDGRNLEGREQQGEEQEENHQKRILSLDEINRLVDGEDDLTQDQLLEVEMMRANGQNVSILA